eukprot:25556-Rhodomonas_salina.1
MMLQVLTRVTELAHTGTRPGRASGDVGSLPCASAVCTQCAVRLLHPAGEIKCNKPHSGPGPNLTRKCHGTEIAVSCIRFRGVPELESALRALSPPRPGPRPGPGTLRKEKKFSWRALSKIITQRCLAWQCPRQLSGSH